MSEIELTGVLEVGADLDPEVSQGHMHDNLSVLDNITAPFTIALDAKLDGIEENANNYSLPVASSSLGGVKTGTDITVDVSGNVSVNDDSHNHIIDNVDGLTDALTKSFAEIYVSSGSGVSQSVPTGTGWTKILLFDTNGESNLSIPNHSNDSITIKKAGRYIVSWTFTTYADTNNFTLTTGLFKNDIEVPNIHVVRKFGTANDISTGTASAIVNCSLDDVITMKCKHNYGSSVTFTVGYATLYVNKISD